jgi:hypothetical protein
MKTRKRVIQVAKKPDHTRVANGTGSDPGFIPIAVILNITSSPCFRTELHIFFGGDNAAFVGNPELDDHLWLVFLYDADHCASVTS